ncbi:MAG: efflux RND transporter permease subunit [Alphaproteobacteria bacterium]
MNFSAFFIKHPRFAIVIAIAMVLFGLMAIAVLPVSQYPEITPPQIIVDATYPGANASVVEDMVAIPIENAVNGVEGMIYMSSNSDDSGKYKLTITFDIGVDPDMAQVKVQNRIQQITSTLPDIVNKEGLNIRTQSSNILGMLVLRSPNNTYNDLYLSNFAYTNLVNPLSRVSGVSDVNVYGPQYSIRVWVNPDKMTSLGLTSNDIVSAITEQNIQSSMGSIGSAPSASSTEIVLTLSAKGLLSTPEEFEEIIVATSPDGGIIRLGDIARVDIGADSYNINATFNDSPAVILGLSQSPNTNSLDIMKNIKKEMELLSQSFPEDMEFAVAYDSTKFVTASISSIVYTLLLTFVLVVAVVFIFLQNIYAVLIPTITIPVSLIATFAALYVFGFNINILTLFAMILAIGLVVDDAIVVVERVQYLMKYKNMDSTTASITAMQEITGAIIATTLVLLAIFVPVGLMAGLTGEIYKQFAITISTSVSFSSVNALTLSPALCAIFLQKGVESNFDMKIRKKFTWFNNSLEYTKNKYLIAVAYFCKKMKTSILILLGVCVVIGGLFYITPTSFIPDEDQGIIFGNIQLADTDSINKTKKVISDMAQKVLKVSGVEFFIGISGSSFLGGSGENIGMGVIGLTPWDDRTSKNLSLQSILNTVRKEYSGRVGESIDFYSLPSIPGVGNSSGISFQLNATNQSLTANDLFGAMQKLLLAINTSPLFRYAFSPFVAETPHIYLDIDRTKLASLNVPLSSFFRALSSNLASTYVNNVVLLGQVNKVIVQADEKHRKSFDDIKNFYIKNSAGKFMQVKNFAELSFTLSPKIYYRFNQYLSAGITAEANENVSSGTAIAEVEKLAKSLGKDYSISWTGLTLQEVQTRGLIVILISLAAIFGYLFLVALYESFLIAFSVMFSTIFAIMGALAGLLLMGLPLSIYAQLGLVLLIGLASKNSILIVEFALDYREKGYDILKSSVEAAGERYRAVLMTAFTFILGVLPMLFTTGAGAASQISMGASVFYGMLIATFVGIVFIPALFSIFDTLRVKLAPQKYQNTKEAK